VVLFSQEKAATGLGLALGKGGKDVAMTIIDNIQVLY